MHENKQKHLEFIQATISRLASHSFVIKGWSVVLVSAFFALAAPNSNIAFVYLAYIPAVIFWGLDGFFLYQERLYRKLYDHVRQLSESDINFSMDATGFKSKKTSWDNATLSKTLIPFHGSLIVSIIIVTLISLT